MMSRRRNMRPGRITLHMNESLPISDKSSLSVHFTVCPSYEGGGYFETFSFWDLDGEVS